MDRQQLAALFNAVAEAQQSGAKQSRRRSGKIGGQEIEGAPLRWVELQDPPAVYFPDAHLVRSWMIKAMVICFLLAFLALTFAVVSITEHDWLFLAIFACATFILGGLGLYLDALSSKQEQRARAGVETLGLYLTPDFLILRERKHTMIAARSEVQSFGARQMAPVRGSSVRFSEFVDIQRNGQAVRADLQRGQHSDQRALYDAWRKGEWPLPLPR